MKRSQTLVAALALATAAMTTAIPAAQAQTFKAGSLEIIAPHAAATRPGQMSDGGFMTIRNTGDAPDYLIGAKGAFADTLQVHRTVVDANGVAKMLPIPELKIPAHGEVKLEHGSYHVMMMGLKRQLTKGEAVPVTLIFKTAGEVTVDFTIDGGIMDKMKMQMKSGG
ncbi:MAG: copper chaperone PCu(A)C [Paracoccaceae bacterium]|nr:copper chaperone PCu(A)C [Paracoccaceae bacterium]